MFIRGVMLSEPLLAKILHFTNYMKVENVFLIVERELNSHKFVVEVSDLLHDDIESALNMEKTQPRQKR